MLPSLLNLRNLSPKILKGRGLCQEVIKQGSEVDLEAIPVLKTWSDDGEIYHNGAVLHAKP